MAVWKPAVTVAAVIERDGHFLFVEERAVEGERVLNQPAGHWEPGETLVEACAREALEEAACRFRPTSLVGIYRWHSDSAGETYLRFAFAGEVLGIDPKGKLDEGILGTVWLPVDALRSPNAQLRSPLTLRCVEDYLRGRRFPLDLVAHVE